jgi:hypothetical protein
MLDTIKIAQIIPSWLLPEILASLPWQEHFDKFTGKRIGWSYKEKEGSKYPYLYLFTAPDGITYLWVSVSLPAFIFGSNVSLPNQLQVGFGLDKLSEYVTGKIRFNFNAKTALVWEVHFTKDYYVGEHLMSLAISKLAEMNIRRFQRGRYRDTSLYFHSKGKGKEENKPRTICIYPKKQDCIDKGFSQEDIQKADGMLRLEPRYNNPDAVRGLVRRLRLPNTEAQNVLTQEVSDVVIAPIQEQILQLLEETDAPERIIKLTQAYGNRRAATLTQFLVYQHFFGRDFYRIKHLGFPRSSYYACQKDCRDIGVLYLFDTTKTKIQVGDVP